MTRGYRFVLTALFALGTATGLAGAASAQQWGPPAQSKYYHDPSNPPTYMAYNTSTYTTQHISAQPQVTPVVHASGVRATAARRRTVSSHRSASHAVSGQ